MSQFAHQTAAIIVDGAETKPYLFDELLTKPTGFFRPATEANKPYAAALLALAKKRARKKTPKDALKAMKLARHNNAVLVARYCLEGWENQTDVNGTDIEFTKDAGLDFLKTLIEDADWVFDRLHNWLRNPDNFAAEDTDDEGDDDALDFEELDAIISSEDDDEDQSLGKSSPASSSGSSDTKKTGSA